MKKKCVIALLILTCIIAIAFPPSRGRIPALLDEDGHRIEGAIAQKCFLDVDGYDIGMIILSKDTNNPVLLVCGGGPGIPEYLMEYMYPSPLTEYFTVCYFDYRGTGLSYHKGAVAEDMTTSRYLSDVAAITDYLCDRFAKDKVYIMGHSFGTYIALNAVKNHPEKYEAYLAMSQCTNQMESEYMGYDYMRDCFAQQHNQAMVDRFDNCPIRDSGKMYDKYFTSSLRDKAMHELGVGTTRDMDSVITGIFIPSLRCTAYTQRERINIWKGKVLSHSFPVTKDSTSFNAFDDVPSVDIPIYFFVGQYDYTCNHDLQRDYYEAIEAPVKRFFLFDDSAHSPIYEQPQRAAEIIGECLK